MSRQEEGLKTKIILASASPRRKQIFRDLGLDHKVVEPDRDLEKKNGDPVRMAIANSILKASYVLGSLEKDGIRYSQ